MTKTRWILGVAGCLTACSGSNGPSNSNSSGASSTGGSAGAPATGGTANNGGATTGTSDASGCPGAGGPSMVKLPQDYCIDSTEVTRSQYAAWLSTTSANTINAQDSTNCSWNTTFTPDVTCMASGDVCQGTNCRKSSARLRRLVRRLRVLQGSWQAAVWSYRGRLKRLCELRRRDCKPMVQCVQFCRCIRVPIWEHAQQFNLQRPRLLACQ